MYYKNARFERTAVNNLLDFSDKELDHEWDTFKLSMKKPLRQQKSQETQYMNLNLNHDNPLTQRSKAVTQTVSKETEQKKISPPKIIIHKPLLSFRLNKIFTVNPPPRIEKLLKDPSLTKRSSSTHRINTLDITRKGNSKAKTIQLRQYKEEVTDMIFRSVPRSSSLHKYMQKKFEDKIPLLTQIIERESSFSMNKIINPKIIQKY